MILITGAAGKTGKAVIRKLADQGVPVKALVFRPAQISEVEALGAKVVIVGDMQNAEIIRRALEGVRSVYHICPNVNPDEVTIGKNIIDTAASTGITHFVYHSVLHPQIEEMPHHWQKLRVEEYLFASGLPFTILQPAAYMQNILVNWGNIIKSGKYTVPYPIESRISMVDLEDVALAAVKVLKDISSDLNQPYHIGATYELVGAPAISQIEIAGILAQLLGHPVYAEKVSLAIWQAEARKSGLGEYQIKTLVAMFDYYGKSGLWGSSQVLSWLLNRLTTSFETFIEREIDAREHA